MYAEAILKKGEGRTLKSGGAWVYDNEIDRVEGDYENGDILAVKDLMVSFWDGALSIPVPKLRSG